MNPEELKSLIIKTSKEKEIALRFSQEFENHLKKVKDNHTKTRLYKQFLKILANPDVGKPLRYSRKGEKEVYLDSFRIYYKFYKEESILRFVEFSHKDEQ